MLCCSNGKGACVTRTIVVFDNISTIILEIVYIFKPNPDLKNTKKCHTFKIVDSFKLFFIL